MSKFIERLSNVLFIWVRAISLLTARVKTARSTHDCLITMPKNPSMKKAFAPLMAEEPAVIIRK